MHCNRPIPGPAEGRPADAGARLAGKAGDEAPARRRAMAGAKGRVTAAMKAMRKATEAVATVAAQAIDDGEVGE